MLKTVSTCLLLIFFLSSFSCKEDKQVPVRIQGQTMGTYYKVSYFDPENKDYKTAIDQLLKTINQEVSTYEAESVISGFNKAESSIKIAEKAGTSGAMQPLYPHFWANYEAAKSVFEQSDGYFDPTVMPLVNYWGFGYEEHRAVTEIDSLKVKALQQTTGMEKIRPVSENNETLLSKAVPESELDFSGIAKGYAVDAIGKLLEQHNIHNYLVDIGGELRASGKKPDGNWTVGINTPSPDAALNDIEVKLRLQDISLATSGNYRNFHEVNGRKYSHTINPKTGFPEQNSLLSASVAAPDCAMADGFATAFMTMGLQKAVEIAENTPGIDAYFIYSDENGKMNVKFTALFEKMIVQ